RPAPLGPRDLHVKALAHKALGQPDETVQAYRELIAREPLRVAWHRELARYLYDVGRLEESHRELLFVLAEAPGDGPARQLLDTVTQELLQEKSDPGRRGQAGRKGTGGRKPPAAPGKKPRG